MNNKKQKEKDRIIREVEINEMMGLRQTSIREYKQKSNKDGVLVFGESCGCGSKRPWLHCCGTKKLMTLKY